MFWGKLPQYSRRFPIRREGASLTGRCSIGCGLAYGVACRRLQVLISFPTPSLPLWTRCSRSSAFSSPAGRNNPLPNLPYFRTRQFLLRFEFAGEPCLYRKSSRGRMRFLGPDRIIYAYHHRSSSLRRRPLKSASRVNRRSSSDAMTPGLLVFPYTLFEKVGFAFQRYIFHKVERVSGAV